MRFGTKGFFRSLLGLGIGAAMALAYIPSCNNETTSGSDAGNTGTPDLSQSSIPDLTAALAPTVTLSSPAAIPNTGNVMVTLTGTNFVPGATVTIAGMPATNVSVVSSTSITLTAPAKAASCGMVAVVVTNPDGQFGTANNILRYRSNTFGFLAAQNTPANSLAAPRNLVVTDVNADGKADILVSLLNSTAVAFLPGMGGASFGAAVTSNVGTQPRAIAVGLLDADTKLDAVVTNAMSNNVSVLLGTGTGTFTAKPTVTAGNAPNAVLLLDLDGDGKKDLVAANSGGGVPAGSVTVAMGNGDGTFKAPSSITLPVGSTGMAAADFNGDGKVDLAIPHGAQGMVSILIGNGAGGFSAPASVNAGGAAANADDIVAADWNGDQKVDVAVANSVSNNVTVLFGMGNGSFSMPPQTTATNGTGPNSLITVDLNGDGLLDLVTANQGGSNLSMMLGQAAGKFAVGTTLGAGTSPRHLASVDLNGDLQPDLVSSNATSGNISVLMSQCN